MSSDLQRIMLVEDEPDIQLVARLALERLGHFTIEICSSGQEALTRLERFAPELMLLDVMMPGLDGPATLAALRRLPAGATLPVSFMTAKVQPHEIAAYMALGAIGTIAKPFDPITLPAEIRALWAQRPGAAGGGRD